MPTLLEKNQAAIKKALYHNAEMKKMQEAYKRAFGTEMKDLPCMEDGFSFKKAENKLRESDNSGAFTQLLRAGVQNIANNAYETVPTTFEKWTTTVASTKDTELYAPIQGLSFPTEVAQQGLYSESHMAGLDIKLQNRKFGSIFPVSYELDADDQTGQVKNMAKLLGEYLKLCVEVYTYGKLASPTGGCTYAQLKVPVSETQPSDETTYPWSTALVGGGANRPASYVALTQTNLQNGFIALRRQKNILGLKMNVDPDKLLISPHYEFDAAVLQNSSFFPSVNTTNGATGQFGAINPIQGKFESVVTRYMPDNNGSFETDSKRWILCDSKKPFFITQIRTGAEIIMENPASGESFNRDVIRFKGRSRFNADFIDSRFAYQGSDGSV